MADDLITRLYALQAELGADELLARLTAVEAQATDTQPPPRRRRDGRRWGEAKRARRNGVDGWEVRRKVGDKRLVFWARTKDELEKVVAAAIAGNARLNRAAAKTSKRRTPKVPPTTMRELRNRLERSYPYAQHSLEELLLRIDRVLPMATDDGHVVGDLHPDELDREDLQIVINELSDHGHKRNGGPLAPGTMRGTIKALQQLGNYGEREFEFRNPARGLILPALTKDVDPFGSWEEVFAVADAFDHLGYPRYAKLTRFACATGLAPQEWAVARPCDLDRDAGTFTVNRTVRNGVEVPQAKNSYRSATFWLPDLALEVVDAFPDFQRCDAADWQRAPLLFPDAFGEMINLHDFRRRAGVDAKGKTWADGPWSRALALAGSRYRPPKQMRHTFAVLALEAGVPLEDVSLMLRHSSVRTTETYYLNRVPKMARRSIDAMNLHTPRYSLRTGNPLR